MLLRSETIRRPHHKRKMSQKIAVSALIAIQLAFLCWYAKELVLELGLSFVIAYVYQLVVPYYI